MFVRMYDVINYDRAPEPAIRGIFLFRAQGTILIMNQ